MDLGISGRVAVVTGATSGIGLATARTLAAEGAAVLLSARGSEALAAAAEEVAAHSPADAPVTSLALDVTDPDAGERLARTALERLGGLDIVVNNAGTSAASDLLGQPDDEWQAQWELNVMGPLRIMRATAPRLAQRGWGRIVNVSSSAGKRPSARNPAYAVTSVAELALSRLFADEFAGSGVLVNAVTPGPVATPLWTAAGGLADQIADASGTTRDEALQAAAKKLPRGRLASAEEIAHVIVFLCSETAANVVGAAWSVDGGAVASYQ